MDKSAQSQAIIKRLYPFHPYTAYLATFVSRAIGSAERSIFEFLNDDNKGFKDFIKNDIDAVKYLTADKVWDFFVEAFSEDRTNNFDAIINKYSMYSAQLEDTAIPELSVFKVILLLNLLNRVTQMDGADQEKSLRAYRQSKVYMRDTQYLSDYYENGNAAASNVYSIYYSLSRQEVLVAPYTNDSSIYVFDGVGAEYLPLLVNLLNENHYETIYCDYAACHLPSITEVNKAYLSSLPYQEWWQDFDREVIHGDFYKMTSNLRKAFDLLEEKVKEIIAESAGNRVIITADHGATARARWKDSKKKYEFVNADHEGRCCKLSSKDGYEDTDNYIIYEDEIKPGSPYAIALNEQSLLNKPKYEDHGGATLEELLVPIIVAQPRETTSQTLYKIYPEKLEVSGLDKIVTFTIVPDPKDVYLIESDSTKHVMNKTGQVYSAKVNKGVEQEIVLFVDGKKYSYRTKSKAKKMMEGDDGFDD